MVNHDDYLSAAARNLKISYLFDVRMNFNVPTSIKLASGLPCPDLFLMQEAAFTLKNGQVVHIPQHLMNVALQYGALYGLPDLIEQMRPLIEKLLAPPHMSERGVMMTSGANAANYCITRAFVDPGDYVFVPEVTYPLMNNVFQDAGARAMPIPSDADGMRPDLLKEALKKSSDGRRKLMYVVPHGDNPTGVTLSVDRQREIYNLACEYDILIVEDDAYYFLQYGSQVRSSFLSLDTEGRVIRVDTFSKTLGAGFRLGYITAGKPFVDVIATIHTTITSSASPFSQVVVSELLRCLGHDGFLEMTQHNAKEYQKKRDMAIQAATKHLTGLCEWRENDGMFLWLKVLGLEDVTEMVKKRCIERGLVLVPGNECMFDATQPNTCIRVSFSMITPDAVDKGFQILAEIIREEQKTRALQNCST